MSITTKKRAELRALAASEDTILTVGKNGVTEAVIESCKEAFNKREIVKGKVLENSMYTPKEVCTILCEELGAEPVQVIGTKFVIYKENDKIRTKS